MSKKIRKRKLEGEEQLIEDWEQKIFPDKIRSEMETMWEIPQIFHFLYLTKDALNLPHLSMYEMERMLLIPRASKQLAIIMTSLLSSPMTKAKLRKIPPMPYEFWTNILAYKMKSWFKIYEAKHQDAIKVLETIGVEPEFWNVFPDAPLLNGKDFEELTFKQKVWLLKTICDTAMHNRKTVQDEMAKQPWEDQFETLLGTDRYGARYIYFPQFLNNDLRVYRHCLENKILSTVTPINYLLLNQIIIIKPKSEKEPENKTSDQKEVMKKKTKYKRRLSRWSNGLTPKLKKKAKKCDKKKHLNDCKCTSDSATGSLINEDTNLSSTSTCRNNNNNNNNNSNNNHISLDIVNVKRPRSSSTCSEMSSGSEKSQIINTRSSGYDTNSSFGSVSGKRSSHRMFKGFSGRTNNNKCRIKIISGILSKLKSGSNEGQNIEDIAIPFTRTSRNRIELNATRQQYLDNIRLHRDGSVDRAIDNLSSISKTDDEKLNEIICAESMKLNDRSSDNVLVDRERETHQVSKISKSDDEKLSETRTSYRQDDNDNSEENRFIRENGRFAVERKLDEELIRSDKASLVKSTDCKDLSLSELRSLLQKEATEDDFSFDEYDRCVKYNRRKLKSKASTERKQETKEFTEMLLELSVSKFQLVADSVDSLRVLVATFLENSNNTTVNADSDLEPMPPCEAKLASKMTELLSSLEGIEPALRDSAKKARARLQKEWTNFKEGSAEIQDSSGQGLSSNWWVLGSQGCSLSTTGDAALQTLSQPTVSSTGSQKATNRSEEELVSHAEQRNSDSQECRECRESQNETQGKQGEGDEWTSQKNSGTEEEAQKDSNEKEQQTRRVLRARGVSSYTEQFYSDDEVGENELEEWADVEAVYATTSAQIDPSTSHITPKLKNTHDRTSEEDSDQDWILPGSRKRKYKRSYANRKLKSFQQKLQNVSVDAPQDSAASKITSPLCNKINPEKPRIKEIQIHTPNKPTESEPFNENGIIENHEAVVKNNPNNTVPFTGTTCKVENVTSVHSELDIKDEGPIYEALPCNYGNYYYSTTSANYTLLNPNPTNYYIAQSNVNPVDSQNTLLQSGPVVSSIIPPVQQNYYLPRGQNYFMESPQSSFVPSQLFHPQGPQMISPQQFINYPHYTPYMVAPSQHQSEYVHTGEQVVSRQIPPNPTMSGSPNSILLSRPSQNRYPIPKQSFPHPNGAVIRSSMPIRRNAPRISNVRSMRNVQQQRNTPARTQTVKKSETPSETNGQKTTSLIMLSDSDDEIEMIITEKCGPEVELEKTKAAAESNVRQPRSKPTVTSDITVVPTKGTIPPQIIQRMNQGGISIIPIKPTTLVQNGGTQLVVVVNETGSHYAIALPNGSKLILTPEQVAQIRASNGGKLVL